MIGVLFGDEGLLPEDARQPWVKTGAGSITLPDGAFLVQGAASFSRVVVDTDTDASPVVRNDDEVYLQAEVQGRSEAGPWPSGASAIMLAITDGLRGLAVSIGSTLQLVDPATGAVVMVAATNHAWTERTIYLLRKQRSERWELSVNGKLVATVPYDFAPASSTAARVSWGSWWASNVATFDAIEASTSALTDSWRLDLAFYSLPSPIRARFSPVWRAILRGAAHLFEGAMRALHDVYSASQAGRVPFTRAEVPQGSIWGAEWSTVGDWSLFSGRIRGPTDGSGASALLAMDLALAPAHVEHRVAATWLVWSYAADPYGRIGPLMRINTGARAVVAQLFESEGAPRWAFTTTTASGFAVEHLGERWPVNPATAHRVEIVVQMEIALLIVDGAIVDRLPLDAFDSVSTADAQALVSLLGVVAQVDLERVTVEQASADQRRRPRRAALAVEELVFLGGRERNEEIEAWAHHRAGMMALRGTSAGIVAELRRICGRDDGAWLTVRREPLAWVLDQSFPEHTPVYLDEPGYDGARVYAHWEHAAPNFTAAGLGRLVLRHLLPISTSEISYYAAVASRLTADPAVASPITTTLTLWSTAHFDAGDQCILRDEAGALFADVTVTAVTDETDLVVSGSFPLIDFPAGSVLMRVLGRS